MRKLTLNELEQARGGSTFVGYGAVAEFIALFISSRFSSRRANRRARIQNFINSGSTTKRA